MNWENEFLSTIEFQPSFPSGTHPSSALAEDLWLTDKSQKIDLKLSLLLSLSLDETDIFMIRSDPDPIIWSRHSKPTQI